jgi:hypothetical protein
MAAVDCTTVVESIDERARLVHDEGWAFSPCVREMPEGLVPIGTPKIDAAVPVADLASVKAGLRLVPGSQMPRP